jgi:hypothetical protein
MLEKLGDLWKLLTPMAAWNLLGFHTPVTLPLPPAFENVYSLGVDPGPRAREQRETEGPGLEQGSSLDSQPTSIDSNIVGSLGVHHTVFHKRVEGFVFDADSATSVIGQEKVTINVESTSFKSALNV